MLRANARLAESSDKEEEDDDNNQVDRTQLWFAYSGSRSRSGGESVSAIQVQDRDLDCLVGVEVEAAGPIIILVWLLKEWKCSNDTSELCFSSCVGRLLLSVAGLLCSRASRERRTTTEMGANFHIRRRQIFTEFAPQMLPEQRSRLSKCKCKSLASKLSNF